MQVQHDFNAQAVAPAKLPIEVAAVFHFRIQGICIGDSEMMAIALKRGAKGLSGLPWLCRGPSPLFARGGQQSRISILDGGSGTEAVKTLGNPHFRPEGETPPVRDRYEPRTSHVRAT